MKRSIITGSLLVLVAVACGFVSGGGREEEPGVPELAKRAVSADREVSQRAIDRLRSRGPAGLRALLQEHRPALLRHDKSVLRDKRDAAWERLSEAINAVGGQYDCHASQLFWHTDLDQAKAAAASEGKPILSLRLLGKLNEECSCANSRFFRTTLYANLTVSQYLRDHFVLHWKSVRPVPKVTIDFGDGRKLQRTLTGNSIHYVLDVHGRTVDALPGLYGPTAFMRHLQRAETLAKSLDRQGASARMVALQNYHRQRIDEINAQWADDLRGLGVKTPNPIAQAILQPAQRAAPQGRAARGAKAPDAAVATALTVSKGRVEANVLAKMNIGQRAAMLANAQRSVGTALEQATTAELWTKIANRHAGDAMLDAGSRKLMLEHNPALLATQLTVTKMQVETPLMKMMFAFQKSIAEDTVRNEYTMHRRIHDWFATGEAALDVDELNERVYAELFLTPRSDPWLGLAPSDVYSALENNGVTNVVKQ